MSNLLSQKEEDLKKKKNATYHLQRMGLEGNIFVLRLSTQLVNFEENKLVVALRMAQVISNQFDGGKFLKFYKHCRQPVIQVLFGRQNL